MPVVTALSVQVRNPDRVNVSIDGRYRLSLDIVQVGDLGVKVGREYDETELAELETESQFGKLYSQALEYSLVRPRSSREMQDYLWRKTQTRKVKKRATGEVVERAGVSKELTHRVHERLVQKGYVSDEMFTRFWVENRNQRKGMSERKLRAELAMKGVSSVLVETVLQESERTDTSELQKVIEKKRARYPDERKFIAYLMRQGFRYDDVREALTAQE